MAVVNKFNVNKEQVTLDADIIENMSANDVSYDDSFQYDENTVGNKLSKLESQQIKLEGMASGAIDAGITQAGQAFYNTYTKLIRYCTNFENNTYITIPYIDGAVYICNEKLYIWNGTDLVTKDVENALSYETQELSDTQKEQARVNIGAIDINKALEIQSQQTTSLYIPNYYINTSESPIVLTPISNSNYSYSICDCTEGQVWIIRGQGGGNPRLYCVIDENNNAILTAGTMINVGVSTQTITIPQGGKKIIVNSITSVEHYAYAQKTNIVQEIGYSTKDVISQNATRDLLQFYQSKRRDFKFVENAYVNTSSSPVSGEMITTGSASSFCYVKSKVNAGETVVIRGQGGSNPRLYSFVDEDGNHIEGYTAGTAINAGVSTQTIIVPPGAKYVYVNSLKAVEHYAYAEPQNNRLMKTDSIVYVAASNSSIFDKASATLVCTGTNDEDVINKAIEMLPYGGKVFLYGGDYYIGGFNKSAAHKPCAILVNDNDVPKYVIIEGIRGQFPNSGGRPTRIIVSDNCYNNLDDNTEVVVIGCESNVVTNWYNNAFTVKDIFIELPNCTKPVICIQQLHAVYAECEGVVCYNRATLDAWISADRPKPRVPLPHINSVGILGVNAANTSRYMRYYECIVAGFGTAYKIGGDHITMINCASAKNIYGYTFGADANISCQHHISLINCCSETDARYMYFGHGVGSKEPIVISNFQIEYEAETAVDYEHKLCEELNPNAEFCGDITYCSMPKSKFFEDGHGLKFKTRNLRDDLSGTIRPSTPNYLQEFYDTSINKIIWYNGSNWIDSNGNVV